MIKFLKSMFVDKPATIVKTPFVLLLEEAQKKQRYQPARFTFNNLKLHVSDMLSVAFQLQEFFIDQHFTFTTEEKKPVIYDCGANVGIASIYFSQKFPNAIIKAFEPDPKLVPYLKENISENNAKNVTVYEQAIWISADGISFGSEGADGGSIFFPGNKVNVKSVRLKDELEKEEKVTFLKLDVEGAEVEIIKDCKNVLHKVQYFFIEYHSWKTAKQDLSDILAILEENNFRYHIDSAMHNNLPFMPDTTNATMDNQLNIYAINTKI